MKIAIIYKSLSGNTEMLANKIRNCFSNEDIVYFGTTKEKIEADLYFIGSWTDRGMCDDEIASFLRNLDNQKIAYFGTAGFGGGEKYYNVLYSRVKDVIPSSNEVLGYFYCQGKMPLQTRQRYVSLLAANPSDKKLQEDIQNFDDALSHPDDKDLEDVQNWAKKIVNL